MTTTNHRCAVLGKPIAHSLSPVLHNAAYRALGLDDWEYTKHEVGESDLDGFLATLDPTWHGLSLTMPLKQTIQPYGTPSNLWARELGVANTAVFDWSETPADAPHGTPKVKLYNTDVVGIQLAFDHASRAHGIVSASTGQGHAVVIGNGNTASSAVAACTMMPEIGRITVIARNPDKNPSLRPLAEKFLRHGNALRAIAMADTEAVLHALAQADVVVNTIPGHAADPLAEALTQSHAATQSASRLLDVVYDPRPTKLMTAWRERGGVAIGGEEMLLYQALIQVLLMTGIWDGDPPSDADERLQDITTDDDQLEIAMRQALEEAL